ncbi:unnamed protein product [Pleuronectes platessa]|uniref:Uncharacterized protein n=1 Tax=Pleuronectes platessa TaxID=8262 RepID=A0A9N7W0H8_PLEPL|nr:unnamed protein product [Pleuronectes platessa]
MEEKKGPRFSPLDGLGGSNGQFSFSSSREDIFIPSPARSNYKEDCPSRRRRRRRKKWGKLCALFLSIPLDEYGLWQSEVSTGTVPFKGKRIKIKGWIWKQLHGINAGTRMWQLRVHCGRSFPAERKDVQGQKLEELRRGWRDISLDRRLREEMLLRDSEGTDTWERWGRDN